MNRLFKIDRNGSGGMSGRLIISVISFCCSFFTSTAFAESADNLLVRIMFAKNEVENATAQEREGVIGMCKEALESENPVAFWRAAQKDCTKFVEMSLVKTFGNSIYLNCLTEFDIYEILEVSYDMSLNREVEDTSESIGRWLSNAVASISEQHESFSSSICVEAIRAISLIE